MSCFYKLYPNIGDTKDNQSNLYLDRWWEKEKERERELKEYMQGA